MKKNQAEIAILLSQNKSSISRELKRNNINGEYFPCESQSTYVQRRLYYKPKKKWENPTLYKSVKNLFLNHQWSPEQISEWLKVESFNYTIRYNTIYRGIYEGLFDEPGLSRENRGAILKLRHKVKSRHTKNYEERRGKIVISNLITEIPQITNYKGRIGDWEVDTVLGQTGKACLVTLNDRKSRYLFCKKISKKNSTEVKNAMVKLLKEQPLKNCKCQLKNGPPL